MFTALQLTTTSVVYDNNEGMSMVSYTLNTKMIGPSFCVLHYQLNKNHRNKVIIG